MAGFRALVERALALGDGYSGVAWLTLVGLGMRVKHRIAPHVAIPLRLRLNGRATTFWVQDAAHLWNLEDVWLSDEYRPIGEGTYDYVLDLGANVGATTLWLADRYPDADIVAVEPHPRMAELLRRNTRHLGRVRVVQAAVGLEQGRTRFQSSQLSWGGHVSETGDIDVLVEPFSALVPQARRTLIKMDIEGSEWSVLGDTASLAAAEAIFGEWHLPSPSEPDPFFRDAARLSGHRVVPTERPYFHMVR